MCPTPCALYVSDDIPEDEYVRKMPHWEKFAKGTKDFELRSFILEFIVTKLADNGLDFGNCHHALKKIFACIVKVLSRSMLSL